MSDAPDDVPLWCIALLLIGSFAAVMGVIAWLVQR